ncbi:succinylglutamate desuccinylase/aspartoacylase family protein [Chelatococcus asaccharovorans]|uniref:succinylglutamate desuccinylase/aspartoacylase family protein n=1 Tax=Chelatococcus asaccharovorans TaxID=28210 RepID=UPI00224C7259|nr:succinylglutamate desuccinylase/aspartoacylase family protein [Chelatococcus asaccharovorans]CAH1652747.1 putative N-alpha-acetyl-L-2,4-diaminobutyric acid deacetylase [Chelatococcus asaccharovorans]CAH1686245.1 putative N-alpha-acetyl-L-2,4-diaminobutyric acid deacetylase [Chelatococcus asaccharovorans]
MEPNETVTGVHDAASTPPDDSGKRSSGPETPIITSLDYDKDGKQHGFLRLYHSQETNGYGYIPIPVISIKNGRGPTALLIGGNHGNEYEGIVGTMNLAREIEAEHVSGRIIILPALNFPAVMAGTRSSPIDGGNLNRSFPGDALGGPTRILAHYVSTVLIPLADVVVDLHAGGRSADFIPCALVKEGRNPREAEELARLAEWFGAPISFVSKGKSGGGGLTLSAECMRRGIPCLTAELGGGATLSRQGLELAVEGVRRILDRLGILTAAAQTSPETRWVQKDANNRIHAHEAGIFEPRIELGESVSTGQLAGLIHFPDFPMRKPEELRFEASGYVLSRHIPALVSRGDELCTFVEDVVR